MEKYIKLAALVFAATLSACGGGGGSSGTTQESYSITLRSDKIQLPLNIDNARAGLGVYAPYTTSLYVEARKGSSPIPGGTDIFGCNVSGGLDSGALYYIDGKPEHEVEVDDGNGGKIKVPGAYRSITLGANSGGNSFHFSSGDKAGTARITCSVTDPRDSRVHTASVDIVVGAATGKPASVRVIAKTPAGYLGTKNNTVTIANQAAIEAFVLDDANQPTASTSGANLQVRILPGTDAAVGARLVAGSQPGGSVLQLPSVGGVAQFSLLSGTETGPIFLEFTADRFDNNVGNGIQDPISAIGQVSVIESVTTPLSMADVNLVDATNTIAYTSLLTVQGGLPPYTWSATGLPNGLTVDSATGLISGIPDDVARTYRATVTVVDKNKLRISGTATLKLLGAIKPEDFAITGCTAEPCALSSATVGSTYVYAFSASVADVTWDIVGLPGWLKSGSTGSSGFISGKPTCADVGTHQFLVTAKKGVTSVTRTVSVQVGDPGPVVCPP